MLDELTVTNLGLLARAHIEPGQGLVVVTGETGAGKTLLLGALRLLRGENARRDQVGPHGDETRVEARFVGHGDDETVVGRRITSSRSRSYLDGGMTTAGELATRVGGLVELVAQHEHQTLATSEGVRRLVDAALDAGGKADLASYSSAWDRLGAARTAIEAIGGDHRALARELEMARFQADDIASAGFARGDDERLRVDAGRLRHHAEIAEALAGALLQLGDEGAGSALDHATRLLDRAAGLDPDLADVARQLAEASATVAELTADLARRTPDDGDFDPAALDDVENRIARLGELQRKYGSDLDEVLDFAEQAAARAAELQTLIDSAADLEAERKAAEQAVSEAGTRLAEARRRAAAALAERATTHLRDLGFSDPVVDIRVDEAPPTARGADRVALRFASSASLEPGPVSRVASGGELSRIVLALRLAAGVADAPVVAFDEIDAGIGGATALAMGRKLAELARGRQVLAVTHLPQVAAFADSHFVVERDGDVASVREVAAEERVEELSRMLSGLPDSERGRRHASELLELARG